MRPLPGGGVCSREGWAVEAPCQPASHRPLRGGGGALPARRTSRDGTRRADLGCGRKRGPHLRRAAACVMPFSGSADPVPSPWPSRSTSDLGPSAIEPSFGSRLSRRSPTEMVHGPRSEARTCPHDAGHPVQGRRPCHSASPSGRFAALGPVAAPRSPGGARGDLGGSRGLLAGLLGGAEPVGRTGRPSAASGGAVDGWEARAGPRGGLPGAGHLHDAPSARGAPCGMATTAALGSSPSEGGPSSPGGRAAMPP
jgi:hypothetical protein